MLYSLLKKNVQGIFWFILIDIFRVVVEANSDDILKLYNIKGNFINISFKLFENIFDIRYKLEVVVFYCNGKDIKFRWLICVIECLKRC